jgi:hypothetical protein
MFFLFVKIKSDTGTIATLATFHLALEFFLEIASSLRIFPFGPVLFDFFSQLFKLSLQRLNFLFLLLGFLTHLHVLEEHLADLIGVQIEHRCLVSEGIRWIHFPIFKNLKYSQYIHHIFLIYFPLLINQNIK